MVHQAASRSAGRMPTGIGGLDEIIDGGLPRGGVTVVLGGAGTGKSIFGMQVLASGARDGHEPGVLVAFEHDAGRILANTAGFVWGGEGLRGSGVHILDAQLSQSVERSGEFDLVGLLAILAAKVEQVGARRVVFDGIDLLLGCLGNSSLVRREVFRLREWVHQSGLSAIVTAKADAADARPAADYDFLQFMADCVVTLHHRVIHGTALRFLRVAKYCGTAHSANEFPSTITSAGLTVAGGTPPRGRVHRHDRAHLHRRRAPGCHARRWLPPRQLGAGHRRAWNGEDQSRRGICRGRFCWGPFAGRRRMTTDARER